MESALKRPVMLIGDLHIHAPANYSYGMHDNYVLDGSLKALDYILDYAVQSYCQSVIFMGDVFSMKDRIPNRLKNRVGRLLQKYASAGLPMAFIVGNHDNAGKDVSIDMFRPFATVVAKPSTIEVPFGREVFKVLLVPYMNKEELEKVLKSARKKVDFVLGHFAVQEAVLNNTGLTLDDGVPMSLLKRQKKVFLGHIHKPQTIGNIEVIGSTYQEDWGEAGQAKRAILWSGTNYREVELPFFVNLIDFEAGDIDDISLDVLATDILPKIQKDQYNFLRVIYSTRISSVEISAFLKYVSDLKNEKGDSLFCKIFLKPVAHVFDNEAGVKKVKATASDMKKFLLRAIKKEVDKKERENYKKVVMEVF